MAVTTTEIYDVLEALSSERKQLLYVLATDMLSAQQSENFDNYTDSEVQAIQNARLRIANGEGVQFSNSADLKAHFDL